MISPGAQPTVADPPMGDAPLPVAPTRESDARDAGSRWRALRVARPTLARWARGGLEVFASLAAAGGLTWSAQNIQVDPLDRIGQVSGLASIGLRFAVAALLGIALLHVASRVRGGAGFDLASRAVCAALAGLTTGFVAAGIVVALRGTPWCLGGTSGDAGRLARWALAEQLGQPWPLYPPLPIKAMAAYASILDLPTGHAFKHLQIIGTAFVGPIAYLSWRALVSPPWALGIGVLSALPLVDPYKPYANTVLIAMVPLLTLFFGWLRRAGELQRGQLVLLGALSGGAFGLLYLLYYGWFQWSAPGAIIALLVLFPWRQRGALERAALLLGSTGAIFAAIAGPLVWRALNEVFPDDYFYFDTRIDPSYFAMWRWDLPGPVGFWPPPGELGGVGLFTFVLAVGLGVAVARGRRHVLVVTVGWLFAGTWLLRFWFAQSMWATQFVQLYPRTSIELLYCSLVLCGYAVYLLLERPPPDGDRTRPGDGFAVGQSPLPSTLIGVVCGLSLIFGSAASSLADRYMPADEKPASLRVLAWNSHHVKER